MSVEQQSDWLLARPFYWLREFAKSNQIIYKPVDKAINKMSVQYYRLFYPLNEY